jgi:hypothetical protein
MAKQKITPNQFTNPYKFEVYRSAALSTTATSTVLIPFDTKIYDTSSNIDVVTNKGRFTAPVTGYYQISARASVSTANPVRLFVSLFKNGVELKRGIDNKTGSTGGLWGSSISTLVPLNATDYLEVFIYSDTTSAVEVGTTTSYYSGYLVSI